jgi:uncharacterized DUF497 family protein
VFDWNEANIAHIAEHGVTPAEAEEAVTHKQIFLNYALRGGEDRFMLIGETRSRRVLIVIVTPRNALTRVVTAYPAKPPHRAFYFVERDKQYGDREESSS